MAGPVYHYRANLPSRRKLPRYYDKTLFLYEWSRHFIKEVKLDENGNLLKINPFRSSFQFLRPMDMDIGPDGAIYLIEWGTRFGGGNADAKVVRIDHLGNVTPPVQLEAASAIRGPFADEPGATVDPSARATTVPMLAARRFCRLRAGVVTRIV
jgi:hypothetical protein